MTTWLTIDEVCEHLGIARSTWGDWVAKGKAPRAKRLPNGRVLIRQDWFDEWLDRLPEATEVAA